MDAVADFFAAYSTTIAFVGINALLGLSVWVTLYAGQLTLGNAAFMAVGAYTAASLGLVVFRLRGVYLAIATLAFGEVVRVILLATPITGRGQGLNGIPPKTELWHVYLSLAVIAYVLWRVQGSTVGRAWAALREDELA